MKERLLNYINFKSMTVNEFEKGAGLSAGTVFHVQKGIRSDKLRDILVAYPDLNPDYVLGISGNMLRDSSQNEMDSLQSEVEKAREQIALYEMVIKKLSK